MLWGEGGPLLGVDCEVGTSGDVQGFRGDIRPVVGMETWMLKRTDRHHNIKKGEKRENQDGGSCHNGFCFRWN